MGGWEALPTGDDCCESEDYNNNIPTHMGMWDRVKTALTILCMAMIGIGIGCLFLFVRWVGGMESMVH